MNADLYFHGTSLSAAKKILKEGFKGDCGDAVWNVSGDGNYFHSLRRYAKANDMKAKEAFDPLLLMCQGQASCAAVKHPDCRRAVLMVDLSGFELEADSSCPNVEDSAVFTHEHIPADRIKMVWQDAANRGEMRAFWLSLVVKNQYFESHGFDEKLLDMARSVYNSGFNVSVDEEFELTLRRGKKRI